MSSKSAKIVGSKPAAAGGAAPRRRGRSGRSAARFSRVGEHRVGLGRFLELLLGRLVARVAVRVVLQRQLAVGALDFLVAWPSARRRAPRSSRACSLPWPPSPSPAAAGGRRACSPRRNSSMTSPSRAPVDRLVGHRLVQVRIEVRAERLDRRRRRACAAGPSSCRWISSTPVCVGLAASAGVGRERALEVVHERQQLAQHVGRRPTSASSRALALDALAVVVELGRLAQQPVVVARRARCCSGSARVAVGRRRRRAGGSARWSSV